MYPNNPQQPQPQQPVQPQGVAGPYPPQQPSAVPQQPFAQPAPQQPFAQSTPQPAPWTQEQSTPAPQQSYEQSAAPTPEGVAPIDYLNQIAAKDTAKGFSRKQIALLGGILIVAFGAFLTMMLLSRAGGGQNVSQMGQILILRTNALAETAKNSQQNIKNQSLGNDNSALAVQLTSASATLSQTLSTAGINVKKTDKNVAAAEAANSEELQATLDDAHLSGTFDRVYAREMAYQLQTLLLLIDDINSRTSNQTFREQLEATRKNLEPIQKKLDSFSAS